MKKKRGERGGGGERFMPQKRGREGRGEKQGWDRAGGREKVGRDRKEGVVYRELWARVKSPLE